jgi:rhodanese-related sulfurtransferase
MRARRPVHVALAAVAVALAALAAVTGDASPTARPSDATELTALELARWIREGRAYLRVIDLRDAQAFASFAIPGADRAGTTELEHAPWDREATIVLYADSAPTARRARAALQARGVQRAYVLAGGIDDWVRTIAAPVLPANPSPEEAARSREIAELSRWFGGVPRIGEVESIARDSVREAMARIRRRGC